MALLTLHEGFLLVKLDRGLKLFYNKIRNKKSYIPHDS